MLAAVADNVSDLRVVLGGLAALVAYPYVIYPLLVGALSRLVRLVGRPKTDSAEGPHTLPTVAVLTAVYNEDQVLREKLDNCRRIAYPRDRVTFWFGSDGSTDATAAILSQVDDPRIAVRLFFERRGKSAVLRSLLEATDAELIVFTDANTMLEPGAVRALADAFHDPRVGYACGRLELQTSAAHGACNTEARYWDLENRLKACESELGVLVAVNGSLFAVRRELLRPAPPGSLTEDQVMGMQTAVEGFRGVFVRRAVGRESVSTRGGEWRRRVRISAGNFQSLFLVPAILNPRRPWLAFCFVSHKLCRWLVPLWLVGLLACSTAAVHDPLMQLALAAQIVFYTCGVAGLLVPPGWRIARALRLPGYFLMMHAAVLAGLGRFVGGHQRVTWEKAERLETADKARTL